MNREEEKIQRLVAFLTGKMSAEEELVFQKELANDREMQAMLDELEQLSDRQHQVSLLKEQRERELEELHGLTKEQQLTYAKEKLKDSSFNRKKDGSEARPGKQMQSTRFRALYRVAAALVAGVILGAWYFTRPPAMNALAQEYYEPFRARQTMGSTDLTDLDTTVRKLQLMNRIAITSNCQSDTIHTVKFKEEVAHLLYQQQHYEQSAALFECVATESRSAYWNSIIANLAADRRDLAEEKLRTLINQPQHPYHRKAIDLLNAME